MPRDPQKRAYSREVDKIRKRTRRAIARLQQQEAESTNYLVKRQARQQIARLQADLANLSARGRDRTYTEKSKEALMSLSSEAARVAPARELSRKKVDFASEIRKASRGGISVLGSKPKEKVQLFYRMTQRFWNRDGVAMRDRNRAIMEGLGVDSMEAAWAKVMGSKEARRVLRQLDISGGIVRDTDDLSEAYQEAERTQYRIDTPTVIMMAQMVEGTKAYGAPL